MIGCDKIIVMNAAPVPSASMPATSVRECAIRPTSGHQAKRVASAATAPTQPEVRSATCSLEFRPISKSRVLGGVNWGGSLRPTWSAPEGGDYSKAHGLSVLRTLGSVGKQNAAEKSEVCRKMRGLAVGGLAPPPSTTQTASPHKTDDADDVVGQREGHRDPRVGQRGCKRARPVPGALVASELGEPVPSRCPQPWG